MQAGLVGRQAAGTVDVVEPGVHILGRVGDGDAIGRGWAVEEQSAMASAASGALAVEQGHARLLVGGQCIRLTQQVPVVGRVSAHDQELVGKQGFFYVLHGDRRRIVGPGRRERRWVELDRRQLVGQRFRVGAHLDRMAPVEWRLHLLQGVDEL